ncbi:MAG: hypothetical protein M3134_05985 [Actinomycetota bacterium]|nr:hypothetical protein [Actinomycetota bacterium]
MAKKKTARSAFKGGYFAGEGPPLGPPPDSWVYQPPQPSESAPKGDLEKALIEAVRAAERGDAIEADEWLALLDKINSEVDKEREVPTA